MNQMSIVDIDQGERELIRYKWSSSETNYYRGFELAKKDRLTWNIMQEKLPGDICVVWLVQNKNVKLPTEWVDDPVIAVRYAP